MTLRIAISRARARRITSRASADQLPGRNVPAGVA
jgi:hypothetical protein